MIVNCKKNNTVVVVNWKNSPQFQSIWIFFSCNSVSFASVILSFVLSDHKFTRERSHTHRPRVRFEKGVDHVLLNKYLPWKSFKFCGTQTLTWWDNVLGILCYIKNLRKLREIHTDVSCNKIVFLYLAFRVFQMNFIVDNNAFVISVLISNVFLNKLVHLFNLLPSWILYAVFEKTEPLEAITRFIQVKTKCLEKKKSSAKLQEQIFFY